MGKQRKLRRAQERASMSQTENAPRIGLKFLNPSRQRHGWNVVDGHMLISETERSFAIARNISLAVSSSDISGENDPLLTVHPMLPTTSEK